MKPHPALHVRIALLFAVALTSPALAQSSEKPVPVREEPNHKVAFENDYIRMIDVHFPAGATTLYHIHTIPSVVIELSNATIVSQEWGAAPPAPRATKPGETRYAPYDEKPLTHRVTNRGPGIFRVLDVELLHATASADAAAPISSPELKLEWEQKLARLYHVALAAEKHLELKADGCAHLLVSVSGAVQTAPNHELKAGEYLYFARSERISINNRDHEDATCVLLELR